MSAGKQCKAQEEEEGSRWWGSVGRKVCVVVEGEGAGTEEGRYGRRNAAGNGRR